MEKRGKRKSKGSTGFSVGKNDPLFVIFEKHLYEFNYENRESFIQTVVRDYLETLARETKAVIPHSRRVSTEATLAQEVSDMLVRKIYGCLQVEEDGGSKHAKLIKIDEVTRAAIAAENAQAALSPQEIKKRISKLIR